MIFYQVRKDSFVMRVSETRKFCRTPAFSLLLPVLILLCASGASADGNVTMESLTIYTTHEWFGRHPTIYFRCREESKVYLPDVVHKNQDYMFTGQASFQPLTTLYGEKCKRCGLYEQDTIKGDDTFYEAELCPKDFAASPEGRLVFFKAKQLNASLLCPECSPRSAEPDKTSTESSEEDEKDESSLAYIIIALVFVILFALGVVAYKIWRKRQRRDQQARFVKMFEDDDDLDTELGLKDDL